MPNSNRGQEGAASVGVVLAAGSSQRLTAATSGHTKAVFPLGGIPLVERAVQTLRAAGVERVIVVVGYEADQVTARLAGTGAEIVEAVDWRAGNGASLAAAERALGATDRFVLMCGDHLFADGALDELVRSPTPAVLVDPSPAPPVWDEGTRVEVSGGMARSFGKQLDEPAVDCGVFLLSGEVFAAAREAAADGDHSLSGAVTRLAATSGVRALEIPDGAWWQDVDTPDDLRVARQLLRRSLGKESDGLVSRRLNRPISTRITMALAPLRLAPSLLSIVTFVVGVWAAWSLSAGRGLMGGLAVHAASVLDGCDGETARLQRTATPRGAAIDAFLDRTIDAAILAGLALWAWNDPSREFRIVVLAASMLIWGVVAAGLRSPTAMFEVPRRDEPRLIALAGGRDARMLILAVGALLGLPMAAFVAALATWAVSALWRVIFVSVLRDRTAFPAGPAPAVTPAAAERSPREAAVASLGRIARILLFPVVAVGTFAVVLPRIADFREVWALISGLSWEATLLLAGLAVWNLVTYWPVLMASMPGLSFKQAAVVCQSSTTVAMTVPAGGAVAVGVSYAMYSSWGFGPAAIASSTLATFVVGTSIKLLLPALALVALLLEGERVTGAASAALAGAVAVGIGGVLFALALQAEGGARRIAQVVGRLVNGVRGWVGRAPITGIERRIAGFRTDLAGLMRDRWRELTATSMVSQLSIFIVFLVVMRLSSIPANDVTWAEALAVFASVRLATSVPIVPGNVGFAELGYIGGLLLVGADPTEAVTAVLLFRFLTYFVQIPIGGFTFLAWRRQRSRQPADSTV